MKQSTLYLFLFFLSSLSLQGQELILPTKQVTFGTNTHTNRDILQSSLVDSENFIYLLGSTENDFTFNDIKIIKLNQDLEEIWTKEISFNTDYSYDRIIKSFLDENDDLVLVCKSFFTNQKERIFVVKINSSGEEQWRLPLIYEEYPDDGINWRSVYADMDNGVLNLLFNYANASIYHPWDWYKISNDGEIISNSEYPDINGSQKIYLRSNFVFNEEEYHTIVVNGAISDSTGNKYQLVSLGQQGTILKRNIEFTNEQIQFFEKSEDHELISTPNGGLIWLVGIDDFFYTPDLTDFKGYMLFYLDSDGTITKFVDIDTTKDKYVIGRSFDENGNLIVVSNNKNKGTEDPLKISIQKYSPVGELIYENTYPLEMAGIIAFFSENKILVYAENNTIFEFDMDLSFQNQMGLNPIQALFFDPINLHIIGDYRFLTGTKESSMYEGSDFLGQRDFSIKKTAPNAAELGEYLFSGIGTSKTRRDGIIKGEDGNYYVGVTENAGPDNLGIGGSRSPKIPHLLTFSPDFELLEDQANNTDIDWGKLDIGYGSEQNSFVIDGTNYEYFYDPDSYTLTLSKNNEVVWARNWASNSHPTHFRLSSNGNMFFRSSGYLHKITMLNELQSIQLNNADILRITLLDNGWVFTVNDHSIQVFGPDLTLINEAALPANYVPSHPNYQPFIQINNHVLFYSGNIVASQENIGIIKIFNQFGEEQKTYSFYDGLRSRYSFLDGNDLITLGNKLKYIVREVSWEVSTLNRYENFVSNIVGEAPSGDSDGDGISDFIDRCPNTMPGSTVDQYGCNLIKILDQNFMVKSVGESCPSSSNGKINISASQNLNYTATLSQNTAVIETQSFTTEINFENLSSGIYDVCITVDGLPEFNQCFELKITAPEPLNVESKLNIINNSIDLKLSGSKLYSIKINDEIVNTAESEISIPLKSTKNFIEILGESDCQGSFEQFIIIGDETKVYPNPTNGDLVVFLGNDDKELVNILLFNTQGRLVFTRNSYPENGEVRINIESLPSGQYFLVTESNKTKLKHKIIKK